MLTHVHPFGVHPNHSADILFDYLEIIISSSYFIFLEESIYQSKEQPTGARMGLSTE